MLWCNSWGWGDGICTGKGGCVIRCHRQAQPMSPSGPRTSPGMSRAAGFIAPWDPRFVKGRNGSPDTGTGEDEFPFSAVRLPTPLILRVQMMNSFLFFYYLFSLQHPLPLPCHSTERAEQMVLCREAGVPMRIQNLPTPRPRGHQRSEKP